MNYKTIIVFWLTTLTAVVCSQAAADEVSATDYGVIANNPGAATSNTLAMRQLVSPVSDGGNQSITGNIIFPGPNNYYFNDVITFRDGIHLNLQGSTLEFNKVAVPSDQGSGFIFAIRDFSIENGRIVVNYDNSDQVLHAGAAIQLGTRWSNGSSYYRGLCDSLLEIPMGNIVVRDIDITANNQGNTARGIVMFGGLDNVTIENVTVDGQGKLTSGILYEFGMATVRTSVSDNDPYYSNCKTTSDPFESSHARNMHFNNITIKNLSSQIDSYGMVLTGAYDIIVDGLTVDNADVGFSGNAGEAAFYNPWGDIPEIRVVTLRNITMTNIGIHGLVLGGSGLFTGGYLDKVLSNYTAADQTDHLDYMVNTVNLNGSLNGYGIFSTSHLVDIRNGNINGFERGIVINNDCTKIYIDNVYIKNTLNYGIQMNFENGIWDTPRPKTGYVKNSVVAGNESNAISMNHVDGFSINGNVFGYTQSPENMVFLGSDVQDVSLFDNSNAQQPILVSDLSSQTVKFGQNITLEAEFSGAVTEYIWFKNGKTITHSDSSSLLLTNIQQTDLGQYRVIAKNGVLESTSSIAEIKLNLSAIFSIIRSYLL